jgi:selenocysteine lyase/cysteine desulfurase
MLNVDMKKLGIDVWASSPYKWSGAPTGVGVLYVRKEIQDQIWPLIASSGWDTNKNATRYETVGQRADPIIFALGEAVDFQNRIGRGRIARRIQTLAGYLKRELKRIPGVRVHTPTDPYLSGGLSAFSIEGVDPNKIVNYVREKYNIVVRTIGRERDRTHGVRVSTNIYVSLKHIDRLLEGVHYLAKHRKG